MAKEFVIQLWMHLMNYELQKNLWLLANKVEGRGGVFSYKNVLLTRQVKI